MFRVLVSGGTGYIGSNFVKRYAGKYELYCLVRKQSDISLIEKSGCCLIRFEKEEDLYEIIDSIKPEVLIHFAGVFLGDHDKNTIGRMIDCNIRFSTMLVDAAVRAGCRRVINTASYWQNFNGREYSPVNLYAATKQAFEDVLQYYVEAEHASVISLMIFDTYGPSDKRRKILNIVNELTDGEQLDMSDGMQKMYFCYIDDVVDAFDVAVQILMGLPDGTKEKFAVRPNHPVALRDVVEILLRRKSKENITIRWGERNHREREIINPDGIGEILPDWNEEYDLERGIRMMTEDNG